MLLKAALNPSAPARTAFVGAGGKTTAMAHLSRELPPPVVVTATTHLALSQVKLGDRWREARSPQDVDEALRGMADVLWLTGPAGADERTAGLAGAALERLRQQAEDAGLPILIEADGARRLPLKAPAAHEPALPPWVEQVVVVAGLSGLDRPLSPETVHRPERFGELAGLAMGERVTVDALARALAHPEGGLKAIPPSARRVALLNQADTPERQAQARSLARHLLPAFSRVVVACLEPGGVAGPVDASQSAGPVLAVYMPVAGIVLAAGESSRFGQPKQLLDWCGQPLVRRAAETALSAGLAPVVVVTGAHGAEVQRALEGLPVTLAHNPDWAAGQSTSLIQGLRALPETAGAAVFLLADQPFVSERLLEALIETHCQTLAPVIAPLVDGRRANPLLFDRATFPGLLALQGDVGGRAVAAHYPITYLEWLDRRLAEDIDTPEDYRRLLEDAGG